MDIFAFAPHTYHGCNSAFVPHFAEGSSQAARKAAAQQIGEVQKGHPYDLQNLLERCHFYLHHTNWDTRVAASQAIEAIVSHVPLWEGKLRTSDVKTEVKDETDQKMDITPSAESKPDVKSMGRLSFANFDVKGVLENGKVLLASEGLEFERAGALSPEELARQRRQIIRDLDLKVTGDEDDSEFLNDDDLKADMDGTVKSSADVAVKDEAASAALQEKLTSARMKNLEKRKKKEAADRPQVNTNVAADAKKTKTVMTDQPQTEGKVVMEAVLDVDRAFEDLNEWPLERFCDELLVELFDKKWEVRHGAALGLREILARHIEGAGKRADSSIEQQRSEQRGWFCDSALRLLCVIMLDRFADFSGDSPIAHVREACAQVLAIIMAKMEDDDLQQAWLVLQTLVLESSRWEVRHGAFLCIKYLVASRSAFVEANLESFIGVFFHGLHDNEADVKGVCADAMYPLIQRNISVAVKSENESSNGSVKMEGVEPTSTISGIVTTEFCTRLLDTLAALLKELDDVSSATNNLLLLLSSLCTLVSEHTGLVPTLDAAVLIPLLLPFFRHAVRSVRSSVLKVISSLLISEQPTSGQWLPTVAGQLFQLLFQNMALEEDAQIVALTLETWKILVQQSAVMRVTMPMAYMLEDGTQVTQDTELSLVGALVTQEVLLSWLNTLALPVGQDIDTTSFLKVPFHGEADNSGFSSTGVSDRSKVSSQSYHNICLGIASLVAIAREFSDLISQIVNVMVTGPKGSERIAAAYLASKWADALSVPSDPSTQMDLSVPQRVDPFSAGLPEWLWDKMLEAASTWEQQIYFTETNALMDDMRLDCKKMVKCFNDNGVTFDLGVRPEEMVYDQLKEFFNITFDQLITHVTDGPPKSNWTPPSQELKGMRVRAQHAAENLQVRQYNLFNTSAALVACAVCTMAYTSNRPPPTLNHVVKPILAALERQADPIWQAHIANSVAALSFTITAPNPRKLIVSRLKAHLYVDRSAIPALAFATEIEASLVAVVATKTKKRKSLADRMTEDDLDGDSDDGAADDGDASASNKKSKAVDVTLAAPAAPAAAAVANNELKEIAKTAAELGFIAMAKVHGASLFQNLPSLWELIQAPLAAEAENEADISVAALLIVTIAPHVHASLKEEMLSLVALLVKRLTLTASMPLRALAAEALASIVRYTAPHSMNVLVKHVIPALNNPDNVSSRRGAALGIHACIATLELEVLPYLIFLIVPILGRMSDQDDIVRKTMSFSFAALVKLMPLEARVPNPPDMPAELVEQRSRERVFLEQLIGGRKVDVYDMPIKIETELRSYQQEGVNWLAFLNKYHLHGILADDMGLGKTLQTICIINSDYVHRAQQFAKTSSSEYKPLPTLVVCPTILVPHWEGEVRRFCDPSITVLQYKGGTQERTSLRHQIATRHIVVTSYDVLRNDAEYLSTLQFNYCVLDEGHIIRNPKTKITQSVKRVRANHRLILSGTPIQNNVLELWSLFDFLMPGFLGSEKQFMSAYSKPVMASRDEKASIRDQERGTLALEALHRQVLPFILRRMKEDVLQDLPPKIIQDVNVDLAPLQKKLYQDFVKNNSPDTEGGDSKHVFQSLQYLRRLSSHPKLVVNPKHPKWDSINDELHSEGKTLDDYTLSPKLVALKELLLGCGIGQEKTGMDAGITQNRVLIFAQLKQMLDIVEHDLFKKEMPLVSYSRLDGDVPNASRMPIVERFNSNPSIDVLLLTVSVGGLGLNLTGANTVIFLEHDWNPQNDLQAMDRVHRIGQTKTVNVYRLITRNTLEEQIMGLQRFKLQIANTVVNKDNQSFQSMDTSQLLDLFATEDGDTKKQAANTGDGAVDQFGNVVTAKSSKGIKGLLDSLEELGDESRYAEEYDLGSFMSKLR